MLNKVLISTNQQIILAFLVLHPDKRFHERELARKTGVSPAGAHQALKSLLTADLIAQEKIGAMRFYFLNQKSLLTNQLKLFILLLTLEPIFEKLKSISEKIILFGPAAKGEFVSESEVNLLIVSDDEKEVHMLLDKARAIKPIDCLLKTPEKWSGFQATEEGNKIIREGIILWG